MSQTNCLQRLSVVLGSLLARALSFLMPFDVIGFNAGSKGRTTSTSSYRYTFYCSFQLNVLLYSVFGTCVHQPLYLFKTWHTIRTCFPQESDLSWREEEWSRNVKTLKLSVWACFAHGPWTQVMTYCRCDSVCTWDCTVYEKCASATAVSGWQVHMSCEVTNDDTCQWGEIWQR